MVYDTRNLRCSQEITYLPGIPLCLLALSGSDYYVSSQKDTCLFGRVKASSGLILLVLVCVGGQSRRSTRGPLS